MEKAAAANNLTYASAYLTPLNRNLAREICQRKMEGISGDNSGA
jgi:hypothetical protein